MRHPKVASLLQKLEFILNRDIEPVAASAEQITEAIQRHYGETEVESVDSVSLYYPEPVFDPEEDGGPLAKLVDLIFYEALKLGADQIHFRPATTDMRITYRIGGEWMERDSPPLRLYELIIARIRVISRLGPADDAGYQMGRIRGNVHGKMPDLHILVRQEGDGVYISLAQVPR